jgi:hypothetical protein
MATEFHTQHCATTAAASAALGLCAQTGGDSTLALVSISEEERARGGGDRCDGGVTAG